MNKFTILIVDDNVNNRFTATSILSHLEVSIIEAENGKDALSCLIRHEVNLILLDIDLPDYSGFEIGKIIKSRKSTMDIPIIFATAYYKTDEFMDKGYEIGAIDYILKPLNINVLLNKVSYYIQIYKEKNKLINELKIKNMELSNNFEELLNMKKQLEQSEENWRLLGENIPYYIEVYNESLEKSFDNQNIVSHQIIKMMKDKKSEFLDQIKSTFDSKKVIVNRIEIQENKKMHYIEIKSFTIWIKNIVHVMVMVSDVTKEHEDEQNMLYIGYHDQLTGLRNRHFFRKHLENLDKKRHLPISIIMADVNGLKLINDSFGHQAGDELIVKASECIMKPIGKTGVLARWGGDEFLAIVTKADSFKVERIISEINKEVKKANKEEEFPLSIALGDATRYEMTFSFEEMIKEAEDKMYVNKMQNQSSYRSSVVDSLKRALFERDYETEEHTERISQMALVMANELNLSQNDKDKLVIVGGLHDIGKIAIPTHVLNSMKPLTELEWNSIKRHPEIGFRICSAVPELSSVADLILSHHERWDGKGYPRGMKENNIPLLARLISILDSFDVITHDRPYKRKQPVEFALTEIEACSGSQFDPNLVSLFIKVYKEYYRK